MNWPHEDLREYIQDHMDALGITSRAELSRLSGVKEGQFSNWWSGKNQPSKDSLVKLAPVLGVPLRNLLLKAGLMTVEEFELDDEPGYGIRPVELFTLDANYDAALADDADLAEALLAEVQRVNQWFDLQWELRQLKEAQGPRTNDRKSRNRLPSRKDS